MAEYTDISQLPQHTFSEISHFFEVYKSLEGKVTAVKSTQGRKEAMEVIRLAMASYIRLFPNGAGEREP
jgi:inorganic pyrophosphatase